MKISLYLVVDSNGRARVVKTRPTRVPGEWIWRLTAETPPAPPIPEVILDIPAQDDATLTEEEAP